MNARAHIASLHRFIIGTLVAAIMFIAVPLGARLAHGQEAPPYNPGNAANPEVVIGSHMAVSGNSPAATTCGTGPIVAGTDTMGSVLTGTGATACTLTFAGVWKFPPFCLVSSPTSLPSYATTTTTLTMTAALASTVIYWSCKRVFNQ